MHASLFGNFREGAVVVVVVKKVAAVKVRNIEVDVAIVIVVGGHDALGKSDLVHSRGVGNILEGSVAFVQEKLARTVFVSDEKVEVAIVIDVGPDGGLRSGGGFRETGSLS